MNDSKIARVWLEIDLKKIRYNLGCISKTVFLSAQAYFMCQHWQKKSN